MHINDVLGDGKGLMQRGSMGLTILLIYLIPIAPQLILSHIAPNIKYTFVDKVQIMADHLSRQTHLQSQTFTLLYPSPIKQASFRMFSCISDMGIELISTFLSLETRLSLIDGSSVQISAISKSSLSHFNKIAIIVLYWSNSIQHASYLVIDEVDIDFANNTSITLDVDHEKITIILYLSQPLLSYDFHSQIHSFSFLQSFQMLSLNSNTLFSLQLTTEMRNQRLLHINIGNEEGQFNFLKSLKILYFAYNGPLLEQKGVRISYYSIDNLLDPSYQQFIADNMFLFNTFYGFSAFFLDTSTPVHIQLQIAHCQHSQTNCLQLSSSDSPFFIKLTYFVIQTNYCSHSAPYFKAPNECYLHCPNNYQTTISTLTCECTLFQHLNNSKLCIANSTILKHIENYFYYFKSSETPDLTQPNTDQNISLKLLQIVCGLLAAIVVLMITVTAVIYWRRRASSRRGNMKGEQMQTVSNIGDSKVKWLRGQVVNEFKKKMACLICNKSNTNFQIYCGHQYHFHCFIRYYCGANKSTACKSTDCKANSFYVFGLFYCVKCEKQYCLINFSDKIFKQYQLLGQMMLLSDSLSLCDDCTNAN